MLGLHEAADGSIWYARHWEGLFHLTGETLAAVPIEGKPRFVATDADGDVWAGGYEGLWRLSGGTRRRYSAADGLADRNVTGIHADPEGNVWVGLQVGLALLRKGEVVASFTSRDGLSDPDIASSTSTGAEASGSGRSTAASTDALVGTSSPSASAWA